MQKRMPLLIKLKQNRVKGEIKMNVIVVCGFPKSGNTWLTRLLAEIIRCPSAGAFLNDGYKEQAMEGLNRQSDSRVYKSHLESSVVLGNISKDYVIYIIRDIRDIVISTFHYWQDKDMFQSYCKTKRGFSSGLSAWTSWDNHVRMWLDTGVYWVKYENLLKDTKEECLKILSNLKIAREDYLIEEAIANQAFEKRKREFIESYDDERASLLYKGQAGTYKEEMSKELQDFIVQENFSIMSYLGYV